MNIRRCSFNCSDHDNSLTLLNAPAFFLLEDLPQLSLGFNSFNRRNVSDISAATMGFFFPWSL